MLRSRNTICNFNTWRRSTKADNFIIHLHFSNISMRAIRRNDVLI